MEPTVNSKVRQLCKAVSEEQDTGRMQRLMDELLQVLNEREFAASLL
ncbi:MAG TPA: hypothetical protein VFA85_04125 [Terriglobales bacterium]|nr:hypothetical protein [Terriglobales bacterium]